MSQTEFAEHIGITQPLVSRYVAQGKIPESCIVKEGKYKRIIVDCAIKALNKNLDQTKTKDALENKNKQKIDPKIENQKRTIKDAGMKIVSLNEAQTLKANYAAELKKLEYEEKNGDLIPKDIVEKEAFEIGRRVRDSILNIPNRISQELSAMHNPHKIAEKLTSDLIEALEELSK